MSEMNIKRLSLVLAAVLFSASFSCALAGERDWSLNNLSKKPVVKQAAIGAAAGVAGGVLSDRTSVGRGAAAGALTGVGTGLVSQSRYFQKRPLLKRTAQGAIVGTGASYALRTNKAKGAVVGAGAGAGYHYVKQYMDKH